MRRLEKGETHDAWSGVGWLFLIGIVVMLFCGIVAAADTAPIEEVTEVTTAPTEDVTEVVDIAAPGMAIETSAKLPQYDPKFVRTIDENGKLFTIRATYKKVTDAERAEAAARFRAMYEKYLLEQQEGGMQISWNTTTPQAPGTMDPGGVPQYMGPYGNYAYSPMPWGPITSVTITSPGTGYTLADTVTVIDYWGTGSGAVVTIASVDGTGNITGLNLVNGGAQYTAPWLIFNSPTGTGASATASIQNLTPNGVYPKGIRKFVDTLPGLGPGAANNLGNYIAVTTANTTAFPAGGAGYTSVPTITIYDDTGTGATAVANMAGPIVTSVAVTNGGVNYSYHPVVVFQGGGATTQAVAGTPTVVNGVITAIPLTGADYYELELVPFSQQFHSDLPTTNGLWGYRQTNGPDPNSTYLGGVIVATRDKPVRVRFVNNLPTSGETANLSVPVDFTIMGAGMGNLGMTANPVYYTQNRAAIHLHGGVTPWISDGTPFQWTTPAGTATPYQRGVSVYNVPDMADPGPNPAQGVLTFYWTNQQSARLMFFHDHAEAITRLNVYVGEATGYVVTDQVEQDMIAGTNVTGINPNGLAVLPGIGTPLVIQDKTFVDNTTIAYQDPTWNWGTDYANVSGAKVPQTGDLWVPHVYMPAENPWDPSGVNAFGRWPYSPWEYPERTGTHGPIENIYYDPFNRPWEPLLTPGTPNPSMVPEAFQDTPMVNGAVYPYMDVEPRAYRFRILSVADDRFYTLNLYVANTTLYSNSLGIPTELNLVTNLDTSNGTNLINPVVPAEAPGPSFIKIGTDGGFLPQPVLVPAQPTTYDAAGNVLLHGLALGPAERADVIVNFSGFEGQTLILYNDAPTPWPGASELYNFYTGNSDQTASGGAPPTLPGYGPNTRTIMAFRVGPAVITPTPDVNLANLNAVFAKTAGKNGVFEVSADEIIVPMAAYNSAFNATFADNFVNLAQSTISFTAFQNYAVSNFNITDKLVMDAFPDAYDEYGRLIGMLGLTSPGGPTGTIFELYGYTSPPVEFIQASIHGSLIGSATDGTQIWRITHAGTDTHPIHWHLYTVQPINRVNLSDGAIIPIPNDEIGWRETLRTNPFQATIVALRPFSTNLPFDLPNSHRAISPSDPLGFQIPIGGPGGLGFLDIIGQPINVVNKAINYGGEFVFHCHILGHEEGDMMHAVVFGDYPNVPLSLIANNIGTDANPVVQLSWKDNSMDETNWTIQRATSANGPWTTIATIPSTTEVFTGMTVTYTDNTVVGGTTYFYKVMAVDVMGDTTTYSNNVPFPTLTTTSNPAARSFGWSSPGGNTTSSVAMDANSSAGEWFAVVRGTDNHLYFNRYTQSTDSWSGWTNISGTTLDEPAVAYTGNSMVHVVVRGTDNGLYYKKLNLTSNTWDAGWTSIGGHTSSAPTLLSLSLAQIPGDPAALPDLWLAVRGTDNHLYTKNWTPSTGWTPSWQAWGGTTVDRPALAMQFNTTTTNGLVTLGVRGVGNGVYIRSFTFGPGGSAFTGPWGAPGGSTLSAPVIRYKDDILRIVVRGTDNHVYYKSGSNPYTALGGTTADMPAVYSWPDQPYIEVSVRGIDSRIYDNLLSLSNKQWSGWIDMGHTALGHPTLSRGTGSDGVLAIRGTNNVVYVMPVVV